MRLQAMNPILLSLRPPKRCLPMILILLFSCSTRCCRTRSRLPSPRIRLKIEKKVLAAHSRVSTPNNKS